MNIFFQERVRDSSAITFNGTAQARKSGAFENDTSEIVTQTEITKVHGPSCCLIIRNARGSGCVAGGIGIMCL